MARLVSIQKSLGAASANLYATSQTPVSGTRLTLTGSLPDTARRVLLTYGSEAAPRTLVLTGTRAGSTISETLSIPSGASGTIASVQDYDSVTSALPLGGGWTAAVTLGTNTVGSTQWFVPDQHDNPFVLTIQTHLVSGAANWSVEESYADVKAPIPLWGSTQQPAPIPVPVPAPGLGNVSADMATTITDVIQGYRLTINSGTGTVLMNATQAGIRQ